MRLQTLIDKTKEIHFEIKSKTVNAYCFEAKGGLLQKIEDVPVRNFLLIFDSGESHTKDLEKINEFINENY